MIDGVAAIMKLLADLDEVGDGLGVLEGGDQVTFQSTGDAVAESR